MASDEARREAAELRLKGPMMTGEQKLGEGLAELPLGRPRQRSHDQAGS
jgi:hypothetical protein